MGKLNIDNVIKRQEKDAKIYRRIANILPDDKRKNSLRLAKEKQFIADLLKELEARRLDEYFGKPTLELSFMQRLRIAVKLILNI